MRSHAERGNEDRLLHTAEVLQVLRKAGATFLTKTWDLRDLPPHYGWKCGLASSAGDFFAGFV